MGIAFEKLPIKIQEKIRRENPDVFGSVGAMETRQSKPTFASPLDSSSKESEGGTSGVEIRCGFIVSLTRKMDDDNLAGAIKNLRDVICEDLGIDDGDPRISFQYHQIKAEYKSDEGVMVFIKAVQTINQIKPCKNH